MGALARFFAKLGPAFLAMIWAEAAGDVGHGCSIKIRDAVSDAAEVEAALNR
jgi:hypothetical protein